ncbi:hypothetical protein [Polaromonas sp. YR568]|uniref:hypothetical protein n=1 Tax=Polaromonas sp. YR568 TaxID=1855301 RepID=UPI00398BF801
MLSIIDTTLQGCRLLEIELKQMPGEAEPPSLLKPKNTSFLNRTGTRQRAFRRRASLHHRPASAYKKAVPAPC